MSEVWEIIDVTIPEGRRHLEIIIAKSRGWKMDKRDGPLIGTVWYQPIRPDGHEPQAEGLFNLTEAEAWAAYAPRYLSDANAVRELMADIRSAESGYAKDQDLMSLFIAGNYLSIAQKWLRYFHEEAGDE